MPGSSSAEESSSAAPKNRQYVSIPVEQDPPSSIDAPNPATAMLPPFRVRRLRNNDNDGVVRMKREEYDQLLKEQPLAALRYIDESDGEVILVRIN